jgi:hypothetical protein
MQAPLPFLQAQYMALFGAFSDQQGLELEDESRKPAARTSIVRIRSVRFAA